MAPSSVVTLGPLESPGLPGLSSLLVSAAPPTALAAARVPSSAALRAPPPSALDPISEPPTLSTGRGRTDTYYFLKKWDHTEYIVSQPAFLTEQYRETFLPTLPLLQESAVWGPRLLSVTLSLLELERSIVPVGGCCLLPCRGHVSRQATRPFVVAGHRLAQPLRAT